MKFFVIRKMRKAAGITQEQLAKSLGINRATLSKYESGVIEPSVSQLERIAEALHISFFDLLDKKEFALFNIGAKEGQDFSEWLNHQVDESWSSMGYTYSDKECELIQSFSTLNGAGQQKALESIEIIAGNPKYQNQEKLSEFERMTEGTEID